MKQAAATVKRHWDGILRWFTSRISNGILEGTNSLIQAARSRARGYRSTKNLIAMIYLLGAGVHSNCKCTGEGVVKNLSGSLVV